MTLPEPSRYGLSDELTGRIDNLPQEPGVYIMRDRKGAVIYVGKAVNLRSRVRSYFNRSGDTRAFVSLLTAVLGDLEVIVVRSEKEALLLEEALIKQHKPPYNVVHKDDKSFITLRLNLRHDYPRIEVFRTHQLVQEGAQPGFRYFGPYSSAAAVRGTLRLLNQHFQLRTCTDHVLQNRSRPCLEYQIGRCMAPCVFEIPQETYRQHVDDAVLFLSGKQDALVDTLQQRMLNASEELRFEEAARLRDQLRDIERTVERQVVADPDRPDSDVVGLARSGNAVAVSILSLRGGRIVGKDNLYFADAELPDDELILQVLDVRAQRPPADLPDEVLLPLELPEGEAEARADYYRELRGRKVEFHAPQRGDKRKLVEIATRNAETLLEDHLRRHETRSRALERLQQRLRLSRRPTVMECFDVSLFQGHEPVASKVVFVDGVPDKSRYRRFVIRSVQGTNDFAMLHEVLVRRLRRGLEEDDLPDLMVIDGGKGQLGVARAAFQDVGIPISATEAEAFSNRTRDDGTPLWPRGRESWVELCSLAKARALKADGRRGYFGRKQLVDEAAPEERWEEGGEEGGSRHSPERVFLPDVKDPIALRTNTAELHLMTRLRDEAHRFAITFHRARRKKSAFRSELDAIPGVGETRKKALLRHFGSLTAVKQASPEELAAVPGVTRATAQRIWQAFQGGEGGEESFTGVGSMLKVPRSED
ncbi:MAG: excinuclease ABC subunit UvrC [Myxococcota bacterium]